MLITLDVENHSVVGEPRRFAEALGPLLGALASRRLRATFFVVGSLAPSWRSELLDLVAQGHEVGLHGHQHRLLRDLGPTGTSDDLARGRDVLGEILGEPPIGYRAPYFGLTGETPWAPDLILEAGFEYSSSVLPAWNPQAGFPKAPRAPFRWANGLVEFPTPVFGAGPLAVPLLGGAYLRLAPSPLVHLAARQARRREGQWTYAHPYDFDVDEPFARYDGQSWLLARLLSLRRGLMLRRVLSVADTAARPLGELAADPEFVARLGSYSF
ncbi:DUF3473 domain-containing protein [Gemmatimonas sp.]|uniref:DUF3473 domain-containing protein n=1 Tax=Gemmatimonas sp. TaxID=1962908 RepID=UPI00356A68DA